MVLGSENCTLKLACYISFCRSTEPSAQSNICHTSGIDDNDSNQWHGWNLNNGVQNFETGHNDAEYPQLKRSKG